MLVLVRDSRFEIGGFETWVEALSRGLPNLGIGVTVLVPGGLGRACIWSTRLQPAKVINVDIAEDVCKQARFILVALQALAQQGQRGVFFTMSYPYINVAGINLAGSPWLPIPVMHGRHPSSFDWMSLGPPKKIIVPSQDFAAECRRELRRRIGNIRAIGKVVTIPHGVAVPPSVSGRQKGPTDCARSGPLRLIVVSRLDEDVKRPWDYIDIASKLVETGVGFRMIILGDGPCLSKMKQVVLDRGLNEYVAFSGPIQHDEVYDHLLDADVLISTSESEAFGLSIAEGLACGCAVVAADAPGAIGSLVTKQTGFRVPIGDITSFARHLQELSTDPVLLASIQKSGPAWIQSRFSADIMLKAYARLIRELCQRVKTGRNWRAPTDICLTPGEAARRRAKLSVASRFRDAIK